MASADNHIRIDRIERYSDSGDKETVYSVKDIIGGEEYYAIKDIPNATLALFLANKRSAAWQNCPVRMPEGR